jgi:hypothetical protein
MIAQQRDTSLVNPFVTVSPRNQAIIEADGSGEWQSPRVDRLGLAPYLNENQ